MQSKLAVVREAALSLVSVRMSWVAFHIDYFAYPPVIIFFFGSAMVSLAITPALMAFCIGLLVWTLAEYLLHRFVLHHWSYIAQFHQAHHDEPRAMIGAPTLLSLSFFSLLALGPTWALAGAPLAFAGFSGFLTGYLAFAAIHHAVHHATGQSPLLRHFKHLHAMHHHGNDNANFGVLTAFWDRIFGTYAEMPKFKRQP